MHHRHRARVEERRDEVAIARRVDAVGDDAREAERLGQELHVDVVGRAGDRARAERHQVGLARARRRTDRRRGGTRPRATATRARRAPAARAAGACTTASPPAPASSA